MEYEKCQATNGLSILRKKKMIEREGKNRKLFRKRAISRLFEKKLLS